jgi:hypothetical protein
MSDKVLVRFEGDDVYEFASMDEYEQALADGDAVAMHGEIIEEVA